MARHDRICLTSINTSPIFVVRIVHNRKRIVSSTDVRFNKKTARVDDPSDLIARVDCLPLYQYVYGFAGEIGLFINTASNGKHCH
jgi:hypothetical protein